MNNQALRILSMLSHSQLLSMYEDSIDQYNLYCHNNDDKDDIGGHISMSMANMELDLKVLERATYEAYTMNRQRVLEADLPF